MRLKRRERERERERETWLKKNGDKLVPKKDKNVKEIM